MMRPFALAGATIALQACLGALSVATGSNSFPLVPGVVLVAYSALVDPPIEAAISAAVIGIFLDALSGTPFGLNALACVLALLAARFFVQFVPRPRGLPAFLFTAGLSASYHFIALTLLYSFSSGREAFGFRGLVVTAIGNGIAALVLFPLTSMVLVALGLQQHDPSLNERLAGKA
jgi:rod shape-determining protein MreD